MRCLNCTIENSDDAKVCQNCGILLSRETQNEEYQNEKDRVCLQWEVPEYNIQAEAIEETNNETIPEIPVHKNKISRKISSKLLKIGIAGVVSLIIINNGV